ncbi:type II secretion system protein [Haloplasma contractile]|uniref:Type II secretion system pseudopilin OxpG protein n=1 Tax=Haloplasma contractile SSD-17B TaxID=1033810 RepID=U2EGQ9_9MOLU|nr:type II secretion system protein [Haloplasma contractile]ERJ13801.1 Type II secretion system pseudopilin OxpG protein [Haloplasma contractile SSD-17B]
MIKTLNKKGMTLMELLAVIVILGIIAAIAVPSVGKLIDNSKQRTAVENANTAVSAARNFAIANDEDLGGDIDFVTPDLTNYETTSYVSTTPTTATHVKITISGLIDEGYLPSSFINSDPYGGYTDGYVLIEKTSNTGTYNFKVYLNGGKDVTTGDTTSDVSQAVDSTTITTDNVQ